jgi:ATP-dependent Clp protease ATP-binding subunit ClpB
MSKTKDTAIHNDYLVRGNDHVAAHKDFEVIGRDEDMRQLAGILMRKNANNVLITGPGGVGLSSLCMGLQASKDKDGTPFDIVGKRFFWLDVDGLFSSGDPTKINDGFQRALRTLSRSPDTVLVIDDMKDFIEAARNNGCTHLINALMHAVRGPDLQAVIEVRDEDLDTVMKCHSDMQELFTLHDVSEPGAAALRQITDKAAVSLSQHHGIVISPDAIATAIDLTSKYRVRDPGLSRAQPERAITLLDRALTSYRLEQHAAPTGLRDLEARLKATETAIAKGTMPEAEAAAQKAALETDIKEMTDDWAAFQKTLRAVYKDQRDGEELIRRYEDELQAQLEKEEADKKAAEAKGEKPAAPVAEPATPGKFSPVGFRNVMSGAGFESKAVQEIRANIAATTKAVEENKVKFAQMTAAHNKDLILPGAAVLKEFSSISGIAADKLSENEREKLLHLEEQLGSRVFGQENAVSRLTDAVITSRIGKRRSDKPPSFLFIGPSGVGKTEIAKALAEALMDNEASLLRVDMSDYMEKHSVAKLIGAPPGYEGYEAGGGILPKAMRSNPRRIILFDEIEKAHPDVFNLFLQILGDGQMNDNVGRRISFADTIILMTSNLGQHNFLDKSMTHAQQFEKTMNEMKEHGLRPEFLNRFNGRENIVPFNTLTPAIIEKIVAREIKKINESYGGEGIGIHMSPESMKEFVAAKYNPEVGARGLPGYINANVESKLARAILMNPEASGTMTVTYDKAKDSLEITAPKAPEIANDPGTKPEKPVVSPTQAFKHS